ncbi:MAG: YihY/virulence factor BrkB family protein [Pseudorhodobacter sp.]
MFQRLSDTWARLNRVDLSLVSAGVAFFGFLSIFPALAAVITIWGFASDPSAIRSQLNLAEDFLPADAFILLHGQVERLLATAGRSLGVTTLVSLAIAIWSARAGVAALIGGVNAIHGFPTRGGVREIVQSLFLTALLVALVLGAMAMALITPLVLAVLPLGPVQSAALEGTNFALGLLLVVTAIALSYRLGPNWSDRRQRPSILSPGLLIAVVLWAAASRGLVFYLTNFADYSRVYGSIGAVAALLLWFYLSAFAVLLGASVDAMRRDAAKVPQ